MSGLRREVTLSEVCYTITYGYTASATNTNTETKFLRITDIVPNQIDWESVPYCEIDSNNLAKYKLKVGDIVIARTGATTGWNKTIKSLPYPTVYASYLIKYSINREIADPFYVGYNLRSSQWYDYVDAIAGGSAQPGANAKQLGSFNFNLPSLYEQKAIASVLSSLDDKIDLLHRQNKTLESMAETLFRQWFIEEAQEDWPETTIGEVFTLNGGSTPSTKNDDFWDGDISWTSPRDLSGSESIFLMSTERKITSLGLKRISSGLLPVRTLLMSSRAPIGYLSITDIPVAINQGYIAIRESSHYHSEYMYLWCKLNMEIIKNSGNGSVFQEISKSSFRDLTFIEPPKEKVQSFNELTRDLFEKNRLNTKQIRRLEKLRNTLLPKLMSGDVRVQYAEEAIASVA